MKTIIRNIILSFKNNRLGFSGRKLSAFAGVFTAIYITIVRLPESAVIDAIDAWLAFILLTLGIVTVQNIIDFKNGRK